MKIPEITLKEILQENKILDDIEIKEIFNYAILSGITFYESLIERNS